MKQQPLVSINIRTYNSAKTLEETLRSVKNQSYPKIEIVISDGHSKDDSVQIAKKYGAIVDYSDNLGDARYQNYRNSSGKYVASLDSDQLMDKKLVEECVFFCEKKNFDALIIAEKSEIKKGTFIEKVLAYDKWVIDQTRDSDVVFGTACPRFFKKDLLKGVKWPRGIGIFDDTILYSQMLKKKAKIKYVSSQSIRHHEATSWSTVFRKFFRYGKSYFNAFQANPSTIAAHSLPRRSYFSKVAFSKPHYFLGLLLVYFVKASAAFMGITVFFITNSVHDLKNKLVE